MNVLGRIMITAFGMRLGLAGGLFVLAQQVGQAIGLAALAGIAAARSSTRHGSLVSGYRAAFLTATGISATVVLIVAALMRTRPVPLPPG